MLLKHLFLPHSARPVNMAVYGEKIMSVGSDQTRSPGDQLQIQFEDAFAIPGFINSHDHLDFNCFPVLGNRTYDHYKEWGKHIHQDYKENIHAVLKIPLKLRSVWGMYKNLLNGITTVVNHGNKLEIEKPLINILQGTQNLHSVGFEKWWKWKLNNPLQVRKDCVIHTGEGTNQLSTDEIDNLIKYNLLNRTLIGVHGVSMNSEQAKRFKALIWCPESNRVLLNQHAPIQNLKNITTVVFGSDSTLTGSWNFWKHLRLARSLQMVTDEELLGMVTSAPARLWHLNAGLLEPKRDADIVVVRMKTNTSAGDALFNANPADIILVVQKGQIRLFDHSLLPQFRSLPVNLSGYQQVRIKDHTKFIQGDLPGLITEIRKYHPDIPFPVEIFETINESHYD